MPLMRSDFQKLYGSRLAYLNRLIGPDSWSEVESQWENYYNIESSSRMKEEMLMWGGFGLFKAMAEDEAVTYDNMVQGPSKVFEHALYGLGFSIGFLASEDDLDGLIAKYAPELGRSERMSIQYLAAGWWNDAISYSTEASLTADTLPYFSTAHTFLRGGGTWSNRPGTAATTLGQSALEAALVSGSKQKDLVGNPMPLPYKRLVIPPDLAPTAYELTDSILRSDTTTNAKNYINGKLSTEVWPFLTSSTGWMTLADKKDMKVFWFWRIKPRTSHGYDFDTERAKTKVLFANSFGALDARGAYCSRGV
jgi:hypothetical protein